MTKQYLHLRLYGPDKTMPYTPKGGGSKPILPKRNREEHGRYIRQCLESAWEASNNEYVATHAERSGIYLDFISSPGFEMAVKSLEDLGQGIRLCNIRKEGSTDSSNSEPITYANVYVPIAKRHVFLDKINKYLNENTNKGNPKNANFIESINEIRKVLLIESFWLDDKKLIPFENAEWCEVWLRGDTTEIIDRFENLLKHLGINSKSGCISFPERVVKLVCTSRKQLEHISLLSDDIAEYRKAKDTAEFFLNQSPGEQAEWVNDLLERLTFEQHSKVSVCILDTGINNGHPLIQPVLANSDCLTVKPEWKTHDHNGHGTLMAGLASYGDIQYLIGNFTQAHISHCLESVKLLPPTGNTENKPELWGDITIQAIARAEINSPERKRILCMAVTSSDTRDKGRPSSWSGAIDQITSGADDNNKRLFIISAGNSTAIDTKFNQIANYPDAQITDSIHDPGQAWNALTVGAFTQLTKITDPCLSGYSPVAKSNQLSPFSTTSMTWDDKWPIKPEVVFEGGNIAVNNDGFVTECNDLRLISTCYQPQKKMFDSFSMTSAATAQAARFAALIHSKYPEYWPETIRALIVHSAEWPKELREQFAENSNKTELKKVLRACGYGVPDMERALYCTNNSLTLIAESKIQPYIKKGSEYRTKDMHLYSMPWPIEILEQLGEIKVQMRITLSYLIEPGPGEIGWKDRYRYPSCALRFDLNSPTESEDEFIKRINKAALAEEEKAETTSPSKYWLIGQARDKGSIHSDLWQGTASELASSNLIAVFPKIGWWRERSHLKKYNKTTRYSLIVSIRAPEQNVDIYTPVAAQIKSSVAVQLLVPYSSVPVKKNKKLRRGNWVAGFPR